MISDLHQLGDPLGAFGDALAHRQHGAPAAAIAHDRKQDSFRGFVWIAVQVWRARLVIPYATSVHAKVSRRVDETYVFAFTG